MRISDWSSDVCSSDLRARARRHRAAEDRGVIERHVAIDRHARMFVDQHLFGISRQVEHLVDLSVADAQPRRLALGALGIGRDAQRQATGDAEFAMPALSREARSEEHTSEIKSLMRIYYAVFCLQK